MDENDARFPLPPIDVQSSPGTLLERAELVDPPAPTRLAGFGILHDVAMELTISGIEPGGAAMVTLTYTGGLPSNARYMKYGRRDNNPATPQDESQLQWYDFSYDPTTATGAEIVGNQIILHFVDGLRGDSGLRSDGVIADPGVFVFLLPPSAHVESVVINDGSRQRSKINSITVSFDALVTIDPGAFELAGNKKNPLKPDSPSHNPAAPWRC